MQKNEMGIKEKQKLHRRFQVDKRAALMNPAWIDAKWLKERFKL